MRDHGGSVSAGHAIDVRKRDLLAYSRTRAEIAPMRTLKAAPDPRAILNAGKTLSGRASPRR